MKLTSSSNFPMSGIGTGINVTPWDFRSSRASFVALRMPGSKFSQNKSLGTPKRTSRRFIEGLLKSPVITESKSDKSATLRAIGPAVSRVIEIGAMPSELTLPTVGRNPAIPHSEAGTRTEPPVSVPMAAGMIRVATAAADPPLLPPGMR